MIFQKPTLSMDAFEQEYESIEDILRENPELRKPELFEEIEDILKQRNQEERRERDRLKMIEKFRLENMRPELFPARTRYGRS